MVHENEDNNNLSYNEFSWRAYGRKVLSEIKDLYREIERLNTGRGEVWRRINGISDQIGVINQEVAELKSHDCDHGKFYRRMEKIDDEVDELQKDVAGLQVKSGIWGILGGALVIVINLFVTDIKSSRNENSQIFNGDPSPHGVQDTEILENHRTVQWHSVYPVHDSTDGLSRDGRPVDQSN